MTISLAAEATSEAMEDVRRAVADLAGEAEKLSTLIAHMKSGD